MRHILNAMRREAANVLGDVALPSSGIVTSYDPGKYAVRLALQPEGNLTGWIPLLTVWVGNGWGITCPPSIGDLVEVTFLNGDIDSGVAGMRVFNDADVPPSTPSGEFWLVHKSGSLMKFHNDGSIEIKGATINSTGEWNHTGTITASVDVVGGGKSLATHIHSGVAAGNANTGGPV